MKYLLCACCRVFSGAVFLFLLSVAVAGDPDTKRLIITSNQILALPSKSVNPGSTTISMYYDMSDSTRDGTYSYGGKLNRWNRYWSQYLGVMSALGANGPLGAFGPLGVLGPVFNIRFDGSSFSTMAPLFGGTFYDANFGPVGVYGPNGPLGEAGPLSPKAYFIDMYHLNEAIDGRREATNDYNDFPHQLDASGVWGVLGPLGPLGALGALGPLGTLGYGKQPGIAINADGDYEINGRIMRSIIVQYDTTDSVRRKYDLHERYTKTRAQTRGPTNDTSFSVYAESISVNGDSYEFTSLYDQFVTIVVVPVNYLDDFDFQTYLARGGVFHDTPLFEANTNVWGPGSGYVDFAVYRARADEKFRIHITKRNRFTGYGYVLYVTGSGFQESTDNGLSYHNADVFGPRPQKNGKRDFNIRGAHQRYVPY